MTRVGLALVLSAAFGCTTYEYEEEVFLEVDGSGRIRMSGSEAIVGALHELDETKAETAAALFKGDGVTLVSVRETERDGRTFVHVQARFSDWEQLCRLPAFHGRECHMERGDEELALGLSVPFPERKAPQGVDPESVLALRFHFPSTVRYHNSPTGIERGNILSWKRTLREHFAGRPLDIHARFGRTTVLAATLRILLLAVGLVAAAIALALWLMVRKGRRELERSINPVPDRIAE